MAAAAPARWRAPCHTPVRASSWLRSVTTTKSHFWRLEADGEMRPASRIRSRSSGGMGASVYWRTLRRARMASHVSMAATLATPGVTETLLVTGLPRNQHVSVTRRLLVTGREGPPVRPTLRAVRVAVYDMVDPEFPVSLVELDEQPLPGPAWARVEVELAGIC